MIPGILLMALLVWLLWRAVLAAERAGKLRDQDDWDPYKKYQ